MADDLVTALETSEVTFANALNNPSGLPRFAEVQVTQWLEKALVAGQDYVLPKAVVEVTLDY